ncbi:hypothetical protein [Roseateles oligotrophus]|uniref:hypothetical protein n=1 Tax=Roseateles oligotrophus TaxID=1769250 RepID=UPI0021E42731|nr:hypothetical protein [Roseateles oligotrophus]
MGTVLNASKLPLTTWFLVIHLRTQSKTGMAALQLMRDLGVSYRSAWLIMHWLMQAILTDLLSDALRRNPWREVSLLKRMPTVICA